MENRNTIPKIRFAGFADAWEQRKLGDIADVTKLAGFEFTEHVVYSDEGTTIALRGLNVKNGSLVLDDVKYIDGSNFSKLSRSKLFINDVLFTYVGTVGELAIIPENERFYLAPNVSRIRFQSDYNPNFMVQQMGSKSFYDYMIFPLIATSSQPALSMENIRKFVVSVPKRKEEQDKIGSFFKDLDHLITLHQRECDLIVKTKKSYLQKMFPKNGEDKPEIRFAGFTDAWEQREFGELLKEFSIKSKVEDEHTVLSSTNSGMEVRDGRVSGTSNLGYKIIENGDLVLSPQNLWIGNINVNDIGIGLVSPSYKTFKFVSVFGSFIEPQLRMPRLMEKYKNASTQGASVVRRNLELDSFYQITIRVPKSDEQRKIGDFFRQLDDLITLHQRELDSLKNMKKSLLQQMFI